MRTLILESAQVHTITPLLIKVFHFSKNFEFSFIVEIRNLEVGLDLGQHLLKLHAKNCAVTSLEMIECGFVAL